ncbi:Gfo/Idh/MocA family protein [Halorhabdus amylolytica]|uniref:Gfo/Idh/MocA family protein n=1 Tax=Halorhabdus amylolytica TaxID=2559573 RepID=UPI0010AA0951|nr:Gfo/Idh/MocA family oxidoreductase [Halorhabdus amylolytica]
MADDKGLRIGILGLGALGQNIATALSELPYEFSGADADPELRTAFAEEYDAETYDTPEALMQSDIDAIVIATPNKFHEAIATKAFEHGLDVLLEKPLAHTLDSARRIEEAAERAEAICMVGFHHRYRNVVEIAKRYVEQGYFGDVTHIEGKFVRRRGVPGRGTWYTSAEIAGGGALIDIGSHVLYNVLDFLEWAAIEDVSGTVRSDFGHNDDYAYLNMWGEDEKGTIYNVEDAINAFLVFEDGSTANLEIAWAENTRSTHSYRILGKKAGAEIDITNTLNAVEPVPDQRNDLTIYEVRSVGTDHFVDSEIMTEQNNPFRTELETFLEAVRSGTRPERCNVHRALEVQGLLSEIYEECGDRV